MAYEMNGAPFVAGAPVPVHGIAWDGGCGIRRVDVSTDEGRTWERAELDADLGRFSFRPWQLTLTPHARGRMTVMARASNAQGTTQTEELIFNAPGYHNNVIQKIGIEIA